MTTPFSTVVSPVRPTTEAHASPAVPDMPPSAEEWLEHTAAQHAQLYHEVVSESDCSDATASRLADALRRVNARLADSLDVPNPVELDLSVPPQRESLDMGSVSMGEIESQLHKRRNNGNHSQRLAKIAAVSSTPPPPARSRSTSPSKAKKRKKHKHKKRRDTTAKQENTTPPPSSSNHQDSGTT